jgi:hypothetical protein
MDFPDQICSSLLYRKLQCDTELLSSVGHLRQKAGQLAETLIRDAEIFTDHTVRHMDALWDIAERILTPEEIERLSSAEAFLLASGFYLHDLGMSYAATTVGRESLMQTPAYSAVVAAAQAGSDPREVKTRALAEAIRQHHAKAAEELAVGKIPGTHTFLLEPQIVREQFGVNCGRIAASHHWSIDRLEAELGSQDVVPMASGRQADLAFVAGVLRLTDYAHINRERAPMLSRLTRDLPPESAVHWNAQANIDGPLRGSGEDELVYSSGSLIQDVDAWWLFYEFARGLDTEIRQVRSFLRRRTVSADRLTLGGVRGAASPSDFAKFVKTDGFLPLEVGVKASSIDRLVRILAGESLYGKNFFAPVRELVQNSVDAVLLKRALAESPADQAVSLLPIEISFSDIDAGPRLLVRDWGVGMSQKVMAEHLLTIASDYWETQFHVDFPKAAGFSPVGRFGIGFLSVFMLGTEIRVSSQRGGSKRYSLTIRGLGKRAELRSIEAESTSGSAVEVKLDQHAAKALEQLPKVLPSLLPMLDVKLKLDFKGTQSTVDPRWVMQLSVIDLKKWVRQASADLFKREPTDWITWSRWNNYGTAELTEKSENETWPLGAPEFRNENVRLVADQSGLSILCLKGFALQMIRTPGFTGVINATDVTPDASRKEGLDFKAGPTLSIARAALKTSIAATLGERKKAGFLPAQVEFVTWCATNYGADVATDSDFPWIQVMEISGNVRFIPFAELMNIASTAEVFFFSLNAQATTVTRRWKARFSEYPQCLYAILTNEVGDVTWVHDTTEVGTLADLSKPESYPALLKIVLTGLAHAWSTSVENLTESPQFHHSSNEVSGFLSRQNGEESL